MQKLRVLDLFSGIGGFSLGLERTGYFETVAFCEIDPFCQKVLRKHWPDVPIYTDIRELSASDVGPVDLICGGFPCQDISIAGRGRGIDGPKSGLWGQYARIIGELRPRYIIVENSPALAFRGLLRVLGDLASLGYDADWHCIPAAAVGAAHRRDRIWIIAHARCVRCAERADSDRQDASPCLSDIRQFMAHPLRRRPLIEPNADPLAFVGARIPDGGEDRAAYVGAALCREPDGVPHIVDRIRSCGNAVFPRLPELIGHAIVAAHFNTERRP